MVVYYDTKDEVEALRDYKETEHRTADAAPLLDLHRAPNEMRSRGAETEGSDSIRGSKTIETDGSTTIRGVRVGALEELERSNTKAVLGTSGARAYVRKSRRR